MNPLSKIAMFLVAVAVLPACPGPKPQAGTPEDVDSAGAVDLGEAYYKQPNHPHVDAGAPAATVDVVPALGADTGTVQKLPDAGPVVVPDTALPSTTPDAGPAQAVDVKSPTLVLDTAPSTTGADVAAVWVPDTGPVLVPDTGPVFVQDTGPVLVPDTGPAVKDTSLGFKDSGSTVKDAGPAILDSAPPVQDTAPIIKDIAVVVDIAPVTVADAVQPPQPPGKVYGMTVDSVWGNLSQIVDALKSLPAKPWVRIVFDYPMQPSDYAAAVSAIAPYAVIVGQPSDSTYNAQMTVEQYRARFQAYVSQLPQIDIWETCNECNGDWLGPNASAQADAATDVVKSAGKKAFFTPYWNTSSCADKHGPYVAWIEKNISTAVKTETDFVAPSIYGSDCDGPEPTYADLDAVVQTFAAMFPNAQVGIGEYGKQGDVTILSYYLGYNNPNPRYIFAGLYWYGAQDLVPKSKPMWSTFAGAMQ